MTLQSIDDVHGSDGLSLGMLGVGDGISDDILKEDLEDTTGLFVDEAGDTLDTTTTRKTADGRLGDTLDVITQDFAMTFGASLSEALSSFATSRHDFLLGLDEYAREGKIYFHSLIFSCFCMANILKNRTCDTFENCSS